MQTKHLFLLPALAFFTCANLRAQVTIGGLTDPKPGTILDLNSDVKGGLILSNVHLDDLFEIPVTFPGAKGADPIALKAGLNGAVIYNTNSATCVGVHVWDGTYWERITSETPASIPGTPLSITSGSANPLGGDNIVFTSTIPGALTYKWYESKNGAPYEYIAVTPTGTFSKTYTPGSYKVKVITDNCRLEESNDVFIAPETLSPNFGSIAGGNIIYVYGDFDYAPLSSYEDKGLVAHFDGIDNRGLGDKRHDFKADKWTELKSGFELPKRGSGKWLSNGFQPDVSDRSFYTTSCPSNFPKGNEPRTVEVIFRTPTSAVQGGNVERYIFGYGGDAANGNAFRVGYRGATRPACPPENPWAFYVIGGMNVFLVTCLSSTPDLETPNTINTVTSTYQNNMNDLLTNSYINNSPAQIIERSGTLNTLQESLWIGLNMINSTLLSARLYNRVLEPEEIAKNAALDQKRYLTPPTVTIGGEPCTEVVVLSPHFLMCKVPPSATTGTRDVVVNGNIIYSGAYTYVAATEFYVSSISPIVGSEGTELTLTGNQLNTITEIKAGNNVCTELSTNTTSCSCKIPSSNSTGEVDITITAGDKTYRFAKVFEYQ